MPIEFPRVGPYRPETAGAERPRADINLTLREATQDDVNFILSSWLQSYAQAACKVEPDKVESLPPRAIPRQRYFAKQQQLIAQLVERRRLLICCDAEMPAFIVGWACGADFKENPEALFPDLVVDWVHVKHGYRMRGVATELLRGLGWTEGREIVASHWVHTASIKARKYQIQFDDYYLKLGTEV